MPSGAIHSRVTIVIAMSALAGSMFAENIDEATFVAGVLTGLIISPDMDTIAETGQYSMHLIRKVPIIGGLLARIWQIFWTPYSLMPHRSPLSHTPVFSTALRVVYMLIPWSWYIPAYWNTISRSGAISLFIWFLGLCASDVAHIYLDNDKSSKEQV